MLTDGAIQRLLALLDSYVQQLETYRGRTIDELRQQVGLAWAVEHGLQLSIQCVIDVCQYLVAELQLTTPATAQEAVESLRDQGVFAAELADTLVRMIRFRNIMVHVYARLDLQRVHDCLQTGLPDFAEFARQVQDFVARQSASEPDTE